jgi:hypothetical protein
MDFSPTETRKELVRWTTKAILTGRYGGDLVLAQARACCWPAEDILSEPEALRQARGVRLLTTAVTTTSAKILNARLDRILRPGSIRNSWLSCMQGR